MASHAHRDMNTTIIVVTVDRERVWSDCRTGYGHAEASMALVLKKRRYRWSRQEVTAPTIATQENEHFKGALLFEGGPLAGRRLDFEAEACPNPSCECDYIILKCSLDGPTLDSDRCRLVPVEMDLDKQRIVNLAALKADPSSTDLAYAMAGEMDDEKWEKLRHVYLHLKQYWTEHTDWDRFDELRTRFPENGTMTTYREILPYAKHLTFMRGEIRWLAVDSYCFNPDCPCREAALCFIQVPEAGGRRAKPTLTVFYDYRKASTHAPEYSSDSRISEQELVGSIKQAYANLDSLLAQRHLVLKKLFRRTHVRTESPKANVKIGRNDPCPCGSGKKHKRCCGA
jgi:hypothetical protein